MNKKIKKQDKKQIKSKGWHYILISFLLWIVVEFITVWHQRFQEWVSYMPWVFFQYLFIILIFWYLL